MASLLHLDSSANRSEESVSRQLTALFAETWRALHGSAGYRYRDLAADPVPPLSSAYCALGRRVEREGLFPRVRVVELAETPAERHEWALTLPLITEVLAARTVLVGAPMYNYSVPAALKGWIDRVSFPGVSSIRKREKACCKRRGSSSSALAAARMARAPRESGGISRRRTCERTSASREYPKRTSRSSAPR